MPRLLVLSACLFLGYHLANGQDIYWDIRGDIDPAVQRLLEASGDSTDAALYEPYAVLHAYGYLLATLARQVDTIILYPGQQYRWTFLTEGNLPPSLISRVSFRRGKYSTTAVNPGKLENLFNAILEESERDGFPFASVKLDSVDITDNEISAAILYQSGPMIRYDSLQISGNARVKARWLQAYLEMQPGDPYDQQALDQAAVNIDRLSFVRQTGPVTVDFIQSRAVLQVPLEYVPANRVDGIIGFLPNEEEGLRVTGQAELSLNNLFNSGNSFDLFWQRMRPETQYLDIHYLHTNIFRSNLDVGLQFNLLKEDTTFINRQFHLALDYQSGKNTLTFFSRFKSARLLETSQYAGITELPEVIDFNLNDYGLSYRFDNIAAGWLGNRGWYSSLLGALGNKKIQRNVGLPAELYDGIELNSLQWRLEGEVRGGLNIGKRSIFFQRYRGAFTQGDQLFLNDLYRLGGFSSLRGFNENQFFASRFFSVTMEWQLYLGESSNIFVFVDQAWLKSLDTTNNPTGFGVGSSLQTAAGLLQLAYAVGRTKDVPVDFRQSKFHFGYIARF